MLTPEVVEALYARYLAGEMVPELAAEAGCTGSGIYWAFARAGLPRLPAGKRVMTPEHPRAIQAIALWDEGHSSKTIAKRLKMGTDTILRLLREAGRNPTERQGRGAIHSRWKGGRSRHTHGYIFVWLPHAERDEWNDGRTYIAEHRLVMARHLGRPLTRKETVHHKNGARDDNRLENLQLRASDHGPGAAWCCSDCGSTRLEPVEIA